MIWCQYRYYTEQPIPNFLWLWEDFTWDFAAITNRIQLNNWLFLENKRVSQYGSARIAA